ncbi:MAG: ribonuclease J, partial [Bacilli bacterium]|nr:ribonuclease J [Bacilli bacterium]
ITHGHEDHIGAIPYLLSQVKINAIYANGLALGLIKDKLSQHKGISSNLIEFKEDEVIKTKNFEISFFRTNHSIPDSFGIDVKTNLGHIVHTGDFKFDFTPIGRQTDYYKIASLAKKNCLLLLSDSTNALVNNFSPSEKKIGENIKTLFDNIKGRIIISTFASNVYRIKQIVEASIACKRKVIIFGRSMEKVIDVSTQMKYINANSDVFIKPDELPFIAPNKITILSTGSQGEPLAALSRIAEGTHKVIKIIEGDTIIFSSSTIPGNKEGVNNTINKLYKQGANVITNTALTDTHTTGHASSAELQLMIDMVKPKYFMPIHGEYAMQVRHKELAVLAGLKEENCFILKNGNVLVLSPRKAEIKGQIYAGYNCIDSSNNIIDEQTVKERKLISDAGVVSITFCVSKNRLVNKPTFTSRGFIYMKNSNELINDIVDKAYRLANTYMYKN